MCNALMPGKLLSVIQRQRVNGVSLKQQIDRPGYLSARPALDRIGTQLTAFSIYQRDQIGALAMHRITFPIPKPLAVIGLDGALAD